MKTPEQPRVAGPLASYAAGFRQDLLRRAYSPWTAPEHMYLMAHLSRWLGGRDLVPAELSEPRIEEFLADRRAGGRVRWSSPRALVPLLGYLRDAGAIPEPRPSVPTSPVEKLLTEFVEYLTSERGLAPATIVNYRRFASLFLAASAPDPNMEGCGLDRLTSTQINTFVLTECAWRSIGSAKNVVIALRVFTRFLFLEGHTTVGLADAVPRAIPWRDGGRSAALDPDDVRRLLVSCDRHKAAGRRDFAILTILARLGLRRSEVACLGLGDVDWRNGEIVVHGKGSRLARLPLPVDVGAAMADYCRRGRPQQGHQAVFLQLQAPYGPLAPHAVTEVMYRACRRAGLTPTGPHRLRHSTATSMRRAGAPLYEIGQILRHGRMTSTALYAKEDLGALGRITQPWPGAEQ